MSAQLLAIGSSLPVEPAAPLGRVAHDRGVAMVIINRDPAPYDELVTEVIRIDITGELEAGRVPKKSNVDGRDQTDDELPVRATLRAGYSPKPALAVHDAP
jgi:hypothetical protein